MAYLSIKTVVQSFEHIISRDEKIDPGLIGLLFVFKHTNEKIAPNKKLFFSKYNVEDDLNSVFSFKDNEQRTNEALMPYIVSPDFIEAIRRQIGNVPINKSALAAICLLDSSFEMGTSNTILENEFVKQFNISPEFDTQCFSSDDQSINITLESNPINKDDLYNKLCSIIGNTDTKKRTITTKGTFLDKPGGTFGQGAFAQKLIQTSTFKDIIFVATSDFQESLFKFGSSQKKSTNSKASNLMLLGPSGTGKSTEARRKLVEDIGVQKENITEVTFHPEYTYSDFIGGLKPSTLFKESSTSVFNPVKANEILFEKKEPIVSFFFEPGPFTVACLNASNNPEQNHAIIIDELNRGNVPEILGDIFQLLDRGNSVSVSNSELITFLQKENPDFYKDGFKIPHNLYIYSTINPADQNVFTLDTAFKRRWKLEYLSINYTQEYCKRWGLSIGDNVYNWLPFIQIINQFLVEDLDLSEDKQLGQFFIHPNEKHSVLEQKEDAIKVLNYLWEDTPKSLRNMIFSSHIRTFSKIHEAVYSSSSGIDVFSSDLSDKLSSCIK